MKETISNLPIRRNTDLECEIESRLLKGLKNRTERGLFLSPIVLQAENGRGYLDFLQSQPRHVPSGIASRA